MFDWLRKAARAPEKPSVTAEVDENPRDEAGYRDLYLALVRSGKPQQAHEIVEHGLQRRSPNNSPADHAHV